MKILCPSKTKEPYASVINELSRRTRVQVEFVKNIPDGEYVVLEEQGELITLETLKKIIKPNSIFVVGGPDGTKIKGKKISLGPHTLNHQIAIIVLLELLFRVKNPTHPYNKH